MRILLPPWFPTTCRNRPFLDCRPLANAELLCNMGSRRSVFLDWNAVAFHPLSLSIDRSAPPEQVVFGSPETQFIRPSRPVSQERPVVRSIDPASVSLDGHDPIRK